MVSKEEVAQTIQESRDLIVESLLSSYKKADLKQVAIQMAHGELIEAYVTVLNKEADHIILGGRRSDEEYKELKDMEQQCEHWIAQRVLKLCGWTEKTASRYFKQEG